MCVHFNFQCLKPGRRRFSSSICSWCWSSPSFSPNWFACVWSRREYSIHSRLFQRPNETWWDNKVSWNPASSGQYLSTWTLIFVVNLVLNVFQNKRRCWFFNISRTALYEDVKMNQWKSHTTLECFRLITAKIPQRTQIASSVTFGIRPFAIAQNSKDTTQDSLLVTYVLKLPTLKNSWIYKHCYIIMYYFVSCTGALILLMLYTYQYFAENAFALVKCVPVKSLEKDLLFIDATVECYQDWQVSVFQKSSLHWMFLFHSWAHSERNLLYRNFLKLVEELTREINKSLLVVFIKRKHWKKKHTLPFSEWVVLWNVLGAVNRF